MGELSQDTTEEKSLLAALLQPILPTHDLKLQPVIVDEILVQKVIMELSNVVHPRRKPCFFSTESDSGSL